MVNMVSFIKNSFSSVASSVYEGVNKNVITPCVDLIQKFQKPLSEQQPVVSEEKPVVAAQSLTAREKLVQIIKEYHPESMTAKVVGTFGTIEAFAKLPELQWEDRFHRGGTDYIDGIHPSDMKDPVMWGFDRWNRLFVAVKSNATLVDTEKGSAKYLSTGVETFFQRYTGDEQTWTSGGHFSHRVNVITSRMDNNNLELFQNLIKGQSISINRYTFSLATSEK